MEDNKLDLLGPALSKVGQEVMRIVGGAPDGIYLYVEIGENWVGPSILKDEGDRVVYLDHDGMDLDYALMDAWWLEPAGKRWTGMEYTIEGANSMPSSSSTTSSAVTRAVTTGASNICAPDTATSR